MTDQKTPQGVDITATQIELQRLEALRLGYSGLTYQQIGDELGVSPATAWRRFQQALEPRKAALNVDSKRAEQLAELELMKRPLMMTLARWSFGDDIYPAIACVREMVHLQEREAKLLGLDKAPHVFDDVADMDELDLAKEMAEWSAAVIAEAERLTREADNLRSSTAKKAKRAEAAKKRKAKAARNAQARERAAVKRGKK